MESFVHKDELESQYFLLPTNETEESSTKGEDSEADTKSLTYRPLEMAQAKKWRLVAFVEFLVIMVMGAIFLKTSLKANKCVEDTSVYSMFIFLG